MNCKDIPENKSEDCFPNKKPIHQFTMRVTRAAANSLVIMGFL
jgi:hypothetical protein